MFGRVWSLYHDPDLRLLHAERSCPEARVAVKYNTIKSVSVLAHEELDLRGCSLCPACVARLAKWPASKPKPPGFR